MANRTEESGQPLPIGAIGLVGRSSTGKTAALIALELTAGQDERLEDWDLVESSELSSYVQALGKDLHGTDRRVLERTSLADSGAMLEMYTGYHRRLLPMPRFMQHAYRVAIPDVAGEAYNRLSGAEEADGPDDDAGEQLLHQLQACSAIICFVDLKPAVDPGKRMDEAARWDAHAAALSSQIVGFNRLLVRLGEVRTRKSPLVVCLAFTKCDLLRDVDASVDLPAETSERVAYFEQRDDGQGLEAGIRQTGDGRVRYSLEDIDDAFREQLETVERRYELAWADDPAHHDAVVMDWLRTHHSHVARRIDDVRKRSNVDLSMVMVSDRGRNSKLARESERLGVPNLIPNANEIEPVRLLSPIRSVLDRLHVRRASAANGRRVVGIAALIGLLLLGWWGPIKFCSWKMQQCLASDRIEAAASWGRRIEKNPLAFLGPEPWVEEAAKGHLGLAGAYEQQAEVADSADTARDARRRMIEASKVAIDLGLSTAGSLQISEALLGDALAEGASSPQGAIGMLEEARGLIGWPAAEPLVVEMITSAIETEVKAIDRAAAVGAKAAAESAQTFDAIRAGVEGLSAPGHFIADEGEAALALEPYLDRIELSRAYQAAAEAAADLSIDRDGAKWRAEILRIDDQVRRSSDQLRAAGGSHSEFAGDVATRVYERIFSLEGDAAGRTNPGVRGLPSVARIEFMGRIASAARSVPEAAKRFNEMATRLETRAWSSAIRIVSAPKFGASVPNRTYELLEHLQGGAVPLAVDVHPLDGLRAVADLRDLERRFLLNHRIEYPRAEETLAKAKNVSASLPESLRSVVEDSMLTMRKRLSEVVRASDEVTVSEVLNFAELAEPDSDLERQLKDFQLCDRFNRELDQGAHSPDLDQAVMEILSDAGRDDVAKSSSLSIIGRWLATDADSAGAVFVFRTSLERCLASSGPSPALRGAIEGFRSRLWRHQELAVSEGHRRSASRLLSRIESSPDRLRDYALLLRAPWADGSIGKRVCVAIVNSLEQPALWSDDGVDLANEVDARASILRHVAKTGLEALRGGGKVERDHWRGQRGAIALGFTGNNLFDDPALSSIRAPLASAVSVRMAHEVVLASEGTNPDWGTVVRPAVEFVLKAADEREGHDALIQAIRKVTSGNAKRDAIVAFHATLCEASSPIDPFREEEWREFRSQIVRKVGAVPDALASYVTSLAGAPDEWHELERLFVLGQGGRHGDLVDQVSKLMLRFDRPFRERLFLEEVESIEKALRRTRGGADLDRDLLARLQTSLRRAEALEAESAAALFRILLARIDRIHSDGIEFVVLPAKRRNGRTSAILLGKHEVSIDLYGRWLELDDAPAPKVKFEDDFSFAATGSGRGGRMSVEYRKSATRPTGRKAVRDQGVFGVDPVAVSAFLEKHGLRLPTSYEWSVAWSRHRLSNDTVDGALDLRTPADFEGAGDVTEDGLTGMRLGVREWVTKGIGPSKRYATFGASWFNKNRFPIPASTVSFDAKTVRGRIDVGFRIAMDMLPAELEEYRDYVINN